MKKKVAILKKVQRNTDGANKIILREVENNFKANGNLGLAYIYDDDDFEDTDFLSADMIDELLPDVDGEDDNKALRVTITLEEVPATEFFADVKKEGSK